MKCLYIVSLAMMIGAFGKYINLETAPTKSNINGYVSSIEEEAEAKCEIEGQVYSDCGPVPECLLACDNLQPPTCPLICYEGCQCPFPLIVDVHRGLQGECVTKDNCSKPFGFTLTVKEGQSDSASCAGTYLHMLDKNEESILLIREKPIYHSEAQNRNIFFTGSNWVITSASNDDLLAVINGSIGGYYGSQLGESPFNESIWSPSYSVVTVYK